jgi:hypothetical protein
MGQKVEAMRVMRRRGGWTKISREDRNGGTSAAKAAGMFSAYVVALRSCRRQAVRMN